MSSEEKLELLFVNLQNLSFRLQAVHWHITGPMFFSIHSLTEQQYVQVAKYVDMLAERLRQFSKHATIDLSIYKDLSIFADFIYDDTDVSMIKNLVDDFKSLLALFQNEIKVFQDKADNVTEDILTDIMVFIEKNIWLLSSHLKS